MYSTGGMCRLYKNTRRSFMIQASERLLWPVAFSDR